MNIVEVWLSLPLEVRESIKREIEERLGEDMRCMSARRQKIWVRKMLKARNLI